MADFRLQHGSPAGVVMVDGTIHRVKGGQVWWVDQGGRVMGPARMAWQPSSMSPAGGVAHRHQIDQPPPGTACAVLVPSGDWGRAVVIPLGGGT